MNATPFFFFCHIKDKNISEGDEQIPQSNPSPKSQGVWLLK